MNRKFNVVIAVVAGLLGSAIMQYAFGQNQPAVTREIRAQSIVLVDPANVVVGTFTSELIPNGVSVLAPGVLPKSPYRVVLRDPAGRVIWTPENPTKLVPLGSK